MVTVHVEQVVVKAVLTLAMNEVRNVGVSEMVPERVCVAAITVTLAVLTGGLNWQ